MDTKIVYTSNISSENYNDFINEGGVAVVDVYATWCGPCMVLSPIIDQLAADFTADGSKVRVGKIDADINHDKVVELGIMSIPTILIYKDGDLVDKHTGSIPKEKLREMIKKHI
jgi:thioredoxin 1